MTSSLERFRKTWICTSCGAVSPTTTSDCEDCDQPRGSGRAKPAQAAILNNHGNGSVQNNVLIVGSDMDNRRETYHVPEAAASSGGWVQASDVEDEAEQLPPYRTAGERALIAGTNVAIWGSAGVIIVGLIFMIGLLALGVNQIMRVIP